MEQDTAPDMADEDVERPAPRSDQRHKAEMALRAARLSLRDANWAKVDERADFHLRQALVLAIFDLTDAVRANANDVSGS